MSIKIHVRFRNGRADEKFELPARLDSQLDSAAVILINDYLRDPTVDGVQVTIEGLNH